MAQVDNQRRGFSPYARALNRDMSVSQTSWHRETILGWNSVFIVFLPRIGFVRSMFNAE